MENGEAMKAWHDAKQHEVWTAQKAEELEREYDAKVKQALKMKIVASLVAGNSVLDIGCGIGYLSDYLPTYVKYLGIDQSEHMLERARVHCPDGAYMQGNLYELDKLNLPKFDTVVALDLLMHQPSLEPGFSRLMSLAKKRLIVTLYINDRDRHHDPQEIGKSREILRYYTQTELKEQFDGLNYEVIKMVGAIWKDIYSFNIGE